MTDTISMDGVSASSLRLLNDDVLVRPDPVESLRASGLFVPNTPSANLLGGVFYGTVIAVGPGRLVEKAPPAQAVANIASVSAAIHRNDDHLVDLVAEAVLDFLNLHTKETHVPNQWKPGDRVMCRQGFGPEVLLREGRHYIVGRGNSEYGHGIIAAWDESHVHCWHKGCGPIVVGAPHALCACGAESDALETRLPSCASCPPGERLAEAVLGGEVTHVPIPSAPNAGDYELRPEDDGRQDV